MGLTVDVGEGAKVVCRIFVCIVLFAGSAWLGNVAAFHFWASGFEDQGQAAREFHRSWGNIFFAGFCAFALGGIVMAVLIVRRLRNQAIKHRYLGMCLAVLFCCQTILSGQAPPETAVRIFRQGGDEYLKGNFAAAEKLFRQAIDMDRSFVEAHEYLGHALFKEERYKEAIPAYRNALRLDSSQHVLPLARRRATIDNLGMAYGISGDLTTAKEHFETAIRNDPAYPMYYYNLACAYGEMGDLDHVMTNLRAAFSRKKNLNEHETMPDPAKDDSFRRFLSDERFQQLLREIQR